MLFAECVLDRYGQKMLDWISWGKKEQGLCAKNEVNCNCDFIYFHVKNKVWNSFIAYSFLFWHDTVLYYNYVFLSCLIWSTLSL